jgi:carbonic anhydrase
VSRIIKGVLSFQRRIFGTKESLFGRLARGQKPLALFITCSDSRINPNLLTLTEPGELFILRNAGNLVPAAGGPANGEEATIEYAVAHLHVRDVILCGHSHCGAVQGLLNPQALEKLPRVAAWLEHARAVLAELPAATALPPEQRLARAIEKNVLLQLEHLRSQPPVRTALDAGTLRLHGWVYHFETGQVDVYDPLTGQFVALSDARRPKWPHEPGAQEAGPADTNI